MKIDIFSHIFPRSYFERMVDVIPDRDSVKRWMTIPVLYDLDARLRVMEQFPGYSQVLTLSMPPIEFVAKPDTSPELARLANDGMAAICKQHPEQFPGFVASLPMNNVPAALEEMKRAIEGLGARGVQVFTNVNGRALDDPEFFPIFERMTGYDLPVWMHPARPPRFADYPGEAKSKYEIWWAFGWPYETSAAMARMVFSGMFDKLPALKIITHHMGAMIPFFEGRVGLGWDQLGTRTSDEDYESLLKSLKRRPLDYFKMFYADTSLSGSFSATRCGLDFFGADHCLFGTDCPFDPEGGPQFIRETIAVIDRLEISERDREKIYSANAIELLRLSREALKA
ncbi:MAG TPA: amidohydrolase family protein [Candidatus Limnocylindria bacterium]|nr:amidohydrolase family protein [Candidatus Limnocylindria bacterium]